MSREEIPADFWRCPQVRDALAARDIGAVYRALRDRGMPQNRIAALTGQAQSEVSDVLGGRAVRSYELLARIADGLGIPRGWMGLAYSEPDTPEQDEEARARQEREKRLGFLSYAGSVVLGGRADADELARVLPPELREGTARGREPRRVGASDLAAMQQLITALRALDHRYGGVGRYGPIAASARRAEEMLELRMTEQVRSGLFAMLCGLHTTAGWMAAENGLVSTARSHYGRALAFGREGDDPLAISRGLYAAGRTELHFGDAESALKLFQLGSMRAESSPLVSSVLQLNCAWAAARTQRRGLALRALDTGRAQHAAAVVAEDYPLFGWFGEADLLGMTGSVQLALGEHESAAANLARAAGARAAGEARSAVFELAGLAEAKLALGEHSTGFRHGRRALALAEGVRSARLPGRLAGLREHCARLAAARNPAQEAARELAARIAELTAPPPPAGSAGPTRQ